MGVVAEKLKELNLSQSYGAGYSSHSGLAESQLPKA